MSTKLNLEKALVQGLLLQLDQTRRERIENCAQGIRKILSTVDFEDGMLVFSLVASEMKDQIK